MTTKKLIDYLKQQTPTQGGSKIEIEQVKQVSTGIRFKKETDFQETPIGKIPKEWKIFRLSELATEMYYGITAKAVEYDTGIKFLRTTDIKDYKASWDSLPFCEITSNSRVSISRYVLRKGDIIVSRAGTVGMSVYVEKDMPNVVFGSYLIKIRINDKIIIPKFLHYYFQTEQYWTQILASSKGSTLKNISLPVLESLVVPVPPPQEQNAIIEILSKIDLAIEKVRLLIDRAEGLKKGLMQELLTKGVGHREYKETPIGKIPKEWQVVRLTDLCSKIKAGGTPLRSKEEYWNGSIPFVKIEDITNSFKYLYSTSEAISEEGLKNSNAWLVPENSLLLAIYGSLGEVAINKIKVATNQAILALVPKDPKDVEYLYYWFLYYKPNWKKYAKPTTQPNLTKEIVEKVPIPYPPPNEREKISEILSTVDKYLEVHKAKLEHLERVKRGLMEVLLTGRVRVIFESS